MVCPGALHAACDAALELGEQAIARSDEVHIAQEQPLTSEAIDKSLAPPVYDHAAHFGGEVLAQLAFAGEFVQAVVGRCAPKEVGKSRGQAALVDQLRIAERRASGLRLADEEEGWRGEHPFEHVANGTERGLAFLHRLLGEALPLRFFCVL